MRGIIARGDNDSDRGAVIPIVALSLVTLIVMTAFSLDIGRQILRRREAQAVADVAALDMSRLLDGRSVTAIEGDPSWNTTRLESAARNNWSSSGLSAESGHWDQVTGTFTRLTGTAVPDAVRVTASDVVNFYFGRVIGVTNGNVSRSAVSIQQPEACIEVGSFAAAFNSNQLSILPSQLNALLHVNLTAVAYSGLANLQINLGDLAAEMGFADPDQFLSSTVTVKDTAQAMANVLQRNGDAADAVVLQSIANSQPPPVGVPPQGSYNVADVVTVQQGSEDAALGTAFNVLDILSGAAFAANGSNAIAVPNFNLGAAGVLTTSITATAVQRPQQGCGAVGLRVTTSQVSSTITLTLTTGTTIALTYNVAQAFGDLVTPLVCEATPQLVNVSVTGSLFTSSISARVPPLFVPITVTPPSQTVGGGTLSFALPSPDPYRVPKRSGSGSAGFTGTNVTGLPAAVQPVLATAFPLIDSLIVNPTMRSLGLEIAGADVSVLATMCRVPALKQ